MQSSPPRSHSEGKARAIRELSASLNHGSARSISPALPAPSDSNPTQHSGFTNDTASTDFFNNDDVLHSTQHDLEVTDTNNTLPRYPNFPRIRSTAKKQSAWQPMRSEPPNPDTSMVNKEFGDFDGQSLTDEEDFSIELGRGMPRSSRSTPAKMSTRDSLYDMTPPTARSRRSLGPEPGSLRRDAQIRRASRNDVDMTASPRPASTRQSHATPSQEPKRTSLAQLHAKVSAEESSLFEERPQSLMYSNTKSTRWNNPKRQNSLPMDGAVDATPRATTTPRSKAAIASQNPTVQSFILPDLPNLTELVSGVFEDGTPVFSKTSRSRFGGANNGSGRPSNYTKVDSVPIAQEEKVIFAGLQLLQDKVAEMERERAEQEKKMEEQELELIELRATTQAQERLRRSDSGLGSTDGEGSSRSSWKVEKTRLEATVQTLRTKLDRTERKIAVVEIEKKRLGSERDNMASQLGVAFQTCEELKTEKATLTSDNDALRQEVDSLRADNEALRDQLEQEEAHHREETVQLRRQVDQTENATQQENASLQAELTRIRTQHDKLRRQADQTDNATRRQNMNLQAELARVRAEHDEHTQQLTRNDVELRKARREQAEYARLKADHEALKAQLDNLKAKREDDLRHWSSSEAALKSRVERRDETIRHFQDMTQEHTNDGMRHDNDQLRRELAELTAHHEKDQQRWSQKEVALKRQVSDAKQMSDMTREILSIRETHNPYNGAPTPATATRHNARSDAHRRPSHRREENTLDRLRSRVQEESRVSRANASFQESHIEESPRKPYIKHSGTSRTSLPTNFGRSVSSPVPRNKPAEIESEPESTTDISLAPRTTYSPFVGRSAASNKHTTTAAVQPPQDLDLTELSEIDPALIANLRRQLEEERLNPRGHDASVSLRQTVREDTIRSERQLRDDTVRSEQQGREDTARTVRHGQDDTVRSAASTKSARQRSLPRKSSMRDVKTNGARFEEDLTGKMSNVGEDNADLTGDGSMVSNMSRRRRSVPTEMTSAFIVPDLKIESRRQAAAKADRTKINLKTHDNENCTVCNPDATTECLRIPKLVPVSSRMPDEADATLRPTQSPKDALGLVVKGLCDERVHLHMELAVMRAMLESHDPSLGRKKRSSYEQGIADLLSRIKAKDDQIYNLYDALEGQKEEDITEQFVEDVTEQLRKEAEGGVANETDKKKAKKVTIQSYHDLEDSDGDELPWEGFEDTGEHNFMGDMARAGVY
ncbi:hypothetical protein P280DRAFT_516636 [Massarina eburnea CBS 473.64]|uniref:Cep57 centrosome microtubule-binding domain-containing protein n=1 Tax=Massarina eburnea CBS 473.64 TaxID=1395130 RepID=A0A6A6S8X5_9PLEO|nr:hypothetical protein P280DRAFT_516636 [Massarina eburnea CBS 473.64]